MTNIEYKKIALEILNVFTTNYFSIFYKQEVRNMVVVFNCTF